MVTTTAGTGVVGDLLADAVAACGRWGRPDLERRLAVAASSLRRSAAVLVVTGEYKRGKSLLVNALLGADVCVVDEDLATAAITVLAYAEVPSARVRRFDGDASIVEEVPIESVEDFVSERGNPENRRGVELVEVGLPNEVLKHGIVLVDTPGVGGLAAAQNQMVARFFPSADAVLFVTDASSELTRPELDLLRAAIDAGPVPIVVESKMDFYPDWRRIVDLDRAHLRRAGVVSGPVPVATPLRTLALATGDAELNDESGFRVLLTTVRDEVLSKVRDLSTRRTLNEIRTVLTEVATTAEARAAALEDPEALAAASDEAAAAVSRLAELRRARSRWSTVLNDGFSDLRGDFDFRLRTTMRRRLDDVDDRIAEVEPDEWGSLFAELRRDVVTDVHELIDSILEASEGIRDRIAELLAEDGLTLPSLDGELGIDVEASWSETDGTTRGTGRLGSSLVGLRGAQGGIIMVGMVGQLVGVALAAPVAIGAGALFGVRQVRSERRRQLERRRAEARQSCRQALDAIQLATANRGRQLTQDLHRLLRDYFAEVVEHAYEAQQQAARSLHDAAQQRQRERQEAAGQLRHTAAAAREMLERCEHALDSADGTT